MRIELRMLPERSDEVCLLLQNFQNTESEFSLDELSLVDKSRADLNGTADADRSRIRNDRAAGRYALLAHLCVSTALGAFNLHRQIRI